MGFMLSPAQSGEVGECQGEQGSVRLTAMSEHLQESLDLFLLFILLSGHTAQQVGSQLPNWWGLVGVGLQGEEGETHSVDRLSTTG